MFGWLRALFLDEKARKAVDAKAKARRGVAARPPMTPQREQLLKDAMAVHRAKRKILDDLSDEDRAKLVAMAITAMMKEPGEPPASVTKKKK